MIPAAMMPPTATPAFSTSSNEASAHARLDERGARRRIDRQHLVQLRQREDDAFGQRQRAAGKTGPRATGDDGYARREREAQRAGDFGFALGQQYGAGLRAIDGKA